jgi:hypothetical protein
VTKAAWRNALDKARSELAGLPGVTSLVREDFAQVPGGRTQFGYRDGVSFPRNRR